MSELMGPPIRFTISDRAKVLLAEMKADPRLQKPNDPAELLAVSWGHHYTHEGEGRGEGVFVSFFLRSQVREFNGKIQTASGVPVILNTTSDLVSKFDGKILDFDEATWFFLRDPEV